MVILKLEKLSDEEDKNSLKLELKFDSSSFIITNPNEHELEPL